MAVLGSTGLLVTGGTLAFSGSPSSEPTTAAPWLAPDPEAEQNWASEANVTLASLDRQLQEIDQVERSWNSLPPQERGEQTPPDVQALAKRKSLLQQQRAVIADELASYQSLRAAKLELSDTERHVAGLDKALAEAQQDRHRASIDPDTTQQLRERRSAGEKLRQEQRQKLDELAGRVQDAMSTPLPSGDHATRSITAAVRDLLKNPSARHSGASPDDAHPPRAGLPVPHPPNILAAPAPTSPSTELRDSITHPREGVGERNPGGLLGGVTGRRPSGPSAAASGPVGRVAPGQRQAGRALDGPLRRAQGAIGSATDAPANPAAAPSTPSTRTTPRLSPRQSRTPAAQPSTSRATPGLGLDDSASGSTRSRQQSPVDDVIDALPFGTGVKRMARSAVADEIRSRQRKGQLSGDQSDDTGGSSATRYRSSGGKKYSGSLSMDDLSSLTDSYASKYSSTSSSKSRASRSSKSSYSDNFERALRYSSGGSGKKSDTGSGDHYRSSGKSSGGKSSGGKSSRNDFAGEAAKAFNPFG
jgi:hypothetical protein